MKPRPKYALKKLHDAVVTLGKGVLRARDELDKDGVIQRFEFTFELTWKTLKIILEDQGVECRTPKECFRAAFKIGIIDEQEQFLDMLEDRNRTSHLYNKEESEKIFRRIRLVYLPAFQQLETHLAEWTT